MKYYFFLIIALSIFTACEGPISEPPIEDPEPMEDPACAEMNEKSLGLVTGVRLFDESGSPIGQVGNPNVTSNNSIRIYPNPNNGIVAISKQNDIKYDLFFFPCAKDTICAAVDFTDFSFDYSIDSLYQVDSTTISIETSDLQIQFHSDLVPGYYKMVFYNEGEDLIIENIYYDPNSTPNEMIDYLSGEF